MIILISGGSGSGKSAYAEKLAVSLAAGKPGAVLYYVATMQIYGEEGRNKVERHRSLRAGKGFVTIEQPANIQEAPINRKAGGTVILLECMSNLAANEMFFANEAKDADEVACKICTDILALAQKAEDMILVTNNVFEDGIAYEAATQSYMEALGRINTRLAALADVVTEVVAGIPVPVKGEL